MIVKKVLYHLSCDVVDCLEEIEIAEPTLAKLGPIASRLDWVIFFAAGYVKCPDHKWMTNLMIGMERSHEPEIGMGVTELMWSDRGIRRRR